MSAALRTPDVFLLRVSVTLATRFSVCFSPET